MAQELSIHRLESIDEGLLCCIACGKIAVQPLLLRCLHSCCSPCADLATTAEGLKRVRCPACGVITDVIPTKHHNSFIAKLVGRSTLGGDKCSFCREDGSPDVVAAVWCTQCQSSLCSACLPGHHRYNRSHVTIALEQVATCNKVLKATAKQQCPKHSKPLDLLCFDCKQAKCSDCAKQCKVSRHATPQHLTGPKAKTFLKDSRESIQLLLERVLGKSEQLLQSKNLIGDIRSARAVHLDVLRTKKKHVMDALSKAFEDSESKLKDCYDQLEDRAVALQNLAEQLHQSVQHASNYVSSLRQSGGDPCLLDQRATLLSRLEVLAKQLDGFREIPGAEKLVELSGSLPQYLSEEVASWMGTPKLTTDCLGRILAEVIACKDAARNGDIAAEHPALHFGPASSSFQSPVHCHDVSMTSEGHLLLAAGQQGLKEYSQSSSELSSWRPAAQSDGRYDEVVAVRSLEDGDSAAVGVLHSRLVLLLRRSSAAAAAGGQWLEERRLALLQSPPRNLSVLGDLLAVTECRPASQPFGLLSMFRYACSMFRPQQPKELQLLQLPSAQLQLLQLSTGQVLYSRNYEYDIQSVALTAAALVTTSWDSVMVDAGRQLCVVDSCSHRGGRQWRYALAREEAVVGVCAAGNLLLVAVLGREFFRRDIDCVRALSAASGLLLQQVVSYNSHRQAYPTWLSLGRGQRMVLAMLSYDEANQNTRNVTVYSEAASSS